MSGSAYALLAALAVASPSFADPIYVCTSSDGTVVLRDFACPPDSTSEMLGDAKRADSREGRADPKSAGAAAEREVRPGMSKNEVRSILGNPIEISQEESVEGRIDVWSYSGSRTLRFDASGQLIR